MYSNFTALRPTLINQNHTRINLWLSNNYHILTQYHGEKYRDLKSSKMTEPPYLLYRALKLQSFNCHTNTLWHSWTQVKTSLNLQK